MARYIDADALLDRLKFKRDNTDNLDGRKRYGLDSAISQVRKAPTADVAEVKHGEWIDNHCTACGITPIGEATWTTLGLTPPRFEWFMGYCPNCGAKMDGERKENTND